MPHYNQKAASLLHQAAALLKEVEKAIEADRERTPEQGQTVSNARRETKACLDAINRPVLEAYLAARKKIPVTSV